MEKEELKILLDKYYCAETTVEEECKIKQYFAHQASDEDSDQPFFEAINSYKMIKTETKIFNSTSEKKYTSLTHWKSIQKSAAIFLLVSTFAAIGYSYLNYKQDRQEEAIRHNAETDLISISKALNKGYDEMNASIESTINLPLKK